MTAWKERRLRVSEPLMKDLIDHADAHGDAASDGDWGRCLTSSLELKKEKLNTKLEEVEGSCN